jgi:hypothetical protein
MLVIFEYFYEPQFIGSSAHILDMNPGFSPKEGGVTSDLFLFLLRHPLIQTVRN